jgi:TonB family protein
MNAFHWIAAAVTLASTLQAQPRDMKGTIDLLKKGSNLSAQDAGKLEERVKKKPDDTEARTELLSYYAAPSAGADLSAVKAARLRHILWLIENDPKHVLFRVSMGVHRLHCAGDDLADPGAYRRVEEAWLEQIKRNSGDAEIRRAAVDAIQYCSPEQAEQILTEAKDSPGLGRLYAAAVLGVTGGSYLSNDPAGSDPEFRKRPFAEKAQRALEEATNKDFLVAAAGALLRDGAILWADGKLDWDYTPLGNRLLAKAERAAPEAISLLTLPTTLPARGERPAITIRVGGNAQQANLIRRVTPLYPQRARELGIQGSVQLTVVLGLDGKVLFLHSDSGPEELTPSAEDAVRQWEYRPTTLNGKPCFVVTRVDVNYVLPPK